MSTDVILQPSSTHRGGRRLVGCSSHDRVQPSAFKRKFLKSLRRGFAAHGGS
jgi:hypothetical protein